LQARALRSRVAPAKEANSMDRFQATGDFGPLIVTVAAAHVAASIVAMCMRSPRRVALGLLFAAVSPAVVGVVGMITWSIWVRLTMDTLMAPTPENLSGGIQSGLYCLQLGAASTAAAMLMAAIVYVRSPLPESPPPGPTGR
jgi:hypothetical protein